MAICPGLYHLTEARDGLLARVRLIGGRLSAPQLLALAEAAEQFGNGRIDVTHRANLQVRGLSATTAPAFAEAMVATGLATTSRERDRLRNVAAPPLAGLDPRELVDVSPIARALDQLLISAPGLDELSPKFSFVVDGGGDHGVAGLAHDLGFLAEVSGDDGPIDYRISLASQATDWLVPAAGVTAIAVALAGECAAAAPDRRRMAGMPAGLGADELIARLARRLAGSPLPYRRPRADGREQAYQSLPNGRLSVTSSVNGTAAVAVGIPPQQSTAATLRLVASLSADHGDGELRLTPWRSVVIAGIATPAVATILAAAHATGLATRPSTLRVIACAGASGCLRTDFDTQSTAQHLAAAIAEQNAAPAGRPATVHICGCRRGCAHPAASDILVLPAAGGRLLIATNAAAASVADDQLQSTTAAGELASQVLARLATA